MSSAPADVHTFMSSLLFLVWLQAGAVWEGISSHPNRSYVFSLLSLLKDKCRKWVFSQPVSPALPSLSPTRSGVPRLGTHFLSKLEKAWLSLRFWTEKNMFFKPPPPMYFPHKPFVHLPLYCCITSIFNRQGSLGSRSSTAPQIPPCALGPAPEIALVSVPFCCVSTSHRL